MLENDDLDAAVAEGIVTDTQAAALRDFALRRRPQHVAEEVNEERFRFMRGFNDFFFAVGIVLLGSGLAYFSRLVDTTGAYLLAAAVTWALAELLVRRMLLVLPGILLACFFVAFVYRAVPADLWSFASVPVLPRVPQSFGGMLAASLWGIGVPVAVAVKAIVTAIAAALFYARFRLPFALLLIAGGCVVAVQAIASQWIGAQQVVLLLCGLGVFAVAMSFDLSDRERVTRRSDNAFWLHLLAAPIIVHSLILMVMTGITTFNMTAPVAAVILVIVAALALVAIVIDRRALFVSALVYLGSVIAYALNSAATDRTVVFFSTLVILGIAVLALGIGWLPLRRALLKLFSPTLVARLPPVTAAS
jgi:hypothetical protein